MGVKLGAAVDFCFLAYDPESDQDKAITASLNMGLGLGLEGVGIEIYLFIVVRERERCLETWCTLIKAHYNSLLLSNMQ